MKFEVSSARGSARGGVVEATLWGGRSERLSFYSLRCLLMCVWLFLLQIYKSISHHFATTSSV